MSGKRSRGGNMDKRVTGRRLQAIRADHFARFPLCVRCAAKSPPRVSLATQLDHTVALEHGGKDTASNRQGLCDECHKDKTAEEFGHTRKPKVRVGLDGFPLPEFGARRSRSS